MRGRAMFHDAYCGGAMPTPDRLSRLQRPASNVAFFVLAGTRNSSAEPVARFVTEPDGTFTLPELSPGTYCVVRQPLTADEETRLLALPPPAPRPPPKTGQTDVDEVCLQRLRLQCDATWTVGGRNFVPSLSLSGSTCPWNRPCTRYHGPLPPRAAPAPSLGPQ